MQSEPKIRPHTSDRKKRALLSAPDFPLLYAFFLRGGHER
jgi:hypothetical protein